MKRKKYNNLLCLLFFSCCSCGNKNQSGEIKKLYLDQQRKNYNYVRDYLLERFTVEEVERIKIQGFYNLLIKFEKKCDDSEFENLRSDVTIAEKILECYRTLYNKFEYKNANLGIIDPDQAKNLKKIIDRAKDVLCENIELYKKDPQCEHLKYLSDLFNDIIAILEGRSVELKIGKDTIISENFEQWIEESIIGKNDESLETKRLTHSSKNEVNKIIALINLYDNRDQIFKENNFTYDNFENLILEKIWNVIIDNMSILKEYDHVEEKNGNINVPSFLMYLYEDLLVFNTEEDKYTSCSFKDDLKDIIYKTIFFSFFYTSDIAIDNEDEESNAADDIIVPKQKNYSFNLLQYLKFDSVEIDKAFQIKTLLLHSLEKLNNTVLPQTIKNINISSTRFVPAQLKEEINKSFLEQIYRTFDPKISMIAFDNVEDVDVASKYLVNDDIFLTPIINLKQLTTPKSLFYGIPCKVSDVDFSFSISARKEYVKNFEDSKNTDQITCIKTIMTFIRYARQGMTEVDYKNFEEFIREQKNECIKKDRNCDLKEFFNFKINIQNAKIIQDRHLVLESKGYKIKTVKDILSMKNRYQMDTFEEILMNKILDLLLLEKLTTK